MRFEDILTDKLKTLQEMFAFLYGVASVEGTHLGKKIEEVCASEIKSHYKPRAAALNCNRDKFDFTKISEEMKECLNFFEYCKG